MKIYITKYALTDGIVESEAEINGGMAVVRKQYSGGLDQYFHGEGKDWHLSKESAIAKAEDMRLKKIASVKKQLSKLEELSFRRMKCHTKNG
jgi:hypothetical protein